VSRPPSSAGVGLLVRSCELSSGHTVGDSEKNQLIVLGAPRSSRNQRLLARSRSSLHSFLTYNVSRFFRCYDDVSCVDAYRHW
jgi:hypothetical protein